MAGQTNTKTFTGGMTKDLDYSLLKDNQYSDAQNYKLISDNSPNGFTLENAEGNTLYIDISSVSAIDDSYYLVGHCYIDPYLVLFYTDNTNEVAPSTTTSKIVRITLDKEYIQEATVIYSDVGGSLNFSTTYPINAVGHYESNDNIKVYWTDGYNDVKQMNIMDANLSTYDVHMFDLIPDFPYNTTTSNSIRPQFNSYVQGNIDCSAIQYAYQYYVPNGPTTVYSPASAIVQIPETNSLQGEIVAGGDQDENSGYGVSFDVILRNEDFTKVRFVAIQYDAYNAIPTVRVFSERDLAADLETSMTITDVGTTLTEITYDEYIVLNNTSFTASDLAIKDNYLFAANTREAAFDVDADCRAYRHNAAGVAQIYEADLGASLNVEDGVQTDYDAVPETHDCVNLYNKSVHTAVDDENTNANIFQADGTTVGAEGDNIQVFVSTRVENIDTIGTTSNDKWATTTFLYEPGERSWQRNEVYRIGVVFRNAKMQPSPVKWICDFKMPPMYDLDDGVGYQMTYAATEVNRRRLGITIAWKAGAAISWSNLGAESFELVAVPRSSADRSILAQGIFQKTYYDSADSTYYPIHLMAAEGYTYAGGTVTASMELVRFISPEISFNKNLEFQADDFIHYLGSFEYIAANIDTTATGIFKYKVYDHYSTTTTLASVEKEEVVDAKIIGYVADEEYRTTVDSMLYQPYVKPEYDIDAGGPCTTHMALSVAGNISTWWTNQAQEVALGNYKRDVFISQYGGIDYYSRQNNTYISVTDPEVPYIGTPAVTSYEGDTFIDWFFYNNACLDLDKIETTTQASIFLFPVESSISLSHRLDDGIHRNLGALPALLTQEISGTWESDVVDGTTRTWEQESALYQYNPVYSQQNNAAIYLADNDNVEPISVYSTRIKNSQLKINGEEQDSFTIFKPNDFIDVDGQHGPINNLEVFKNNLYFWQNSAVGIASVNTRSLIQDNQPGILALGTGGILNRIDYLSDTVGNQNQFGIAKSDSSLYWVDNDKNEFFKLSEDLQSISKIGGIQSWINATGQIGSAALVYDRKYNDIIYTITFARTIDAETVSTDFVTQASISGYSDLTNTADYDMKMYGRYSGEAIAPEKNVLEGIGGSTWNLSTTPYGTTASFFYATLYNDPTQTYTITYNELVGSFVSFNSFTPVYYIEAESTFLSSNNYHDLYYHNTSTAERCNYYGTVYDSEFTTVFNKEFPFTKTWDNLRWYTESVDSSNVNQFQDTFDTLTVYNDYQHTGDRDLYYKGGIVPGTRPTEIVRRDRTFSMAMPRDIVDIDVSSNPDITNSANWDETQTFKERIRDKYIVVNTTYNNTNDYTFSIPFMSATFRKSRR